MKINIQIEDANLEDLQRVFGEIHWLRLAVTRPVKDNTKPKPEVSTPTCIEEKGCPETGLTDTCEKCSPPPKSKTKAKKKPKVSVRTGNQYGIPHHLFSEDKRKYQRIWSRCKAKGIKYEEALKLEGGDALPGKPDHIQQEKDRHAIVAKNGTIRVGQFVKHNGSHASPFFGKVGEVIKVNDKGEIFVKFGSSTTWIPQYIVMVMPEAPVS